MTNIRTTINCRRIACVCLLWGFASTMQAATHYVVPTSLAISPADPYTNWTMAGTNIIEVVNAAMTNTGTRVVWVTNGEYCLTNQIVMTNIITVRSFSGNYSNTIVYAGWPAYTNRCFYVGTGTVDGFTISNGFWYGTGSNEQTGGGGAYIGSAGTVQNCNFVNNICSNGAGYAGGGGAWVVTGGTISNCTFFANRSYAISALTSRGCGGAIYMYGGKVLNCLVISNSAIGTGASQGPGGGIMTRDKVSVISNCFIAYCDAIRGGGIYLGAYSTITDCVISNNTSTLDGGGITMQNNATQMVNCIIVNNCSSNGGGVYLTSGNYPPSTNNIPIVTSCNIYGNRSRAGGGIYIYTGSTNRIIDSCKISNNICTNGMGGGIYMTVGGGADCMTNGGQVRNCLISNNTNLSAAGYGGGVYLTNSSTTSDKPYGLINCTIVNNYSTNEGGGIAVSGTTNYIVNCVVDGNRSSSNNFPDIYNTGANSNGYWYSCATGVVFAPFQGNITSPPAFKNPGTGNYRLTANSPCVNKGTNQDWMTGAFDLDGKQRIRYGTVDMGAYEKIYGGTIVGVH